MFWDQLTSVQLAEADKQTPVLLNIAAIEQHGAHLPVATDRMIGEYFSGLLNKELGDKILILPIVAVGCSDHHMGFCGTLTLSHTTFSAVVKEVIQSVLNHGFYNIILLNSHGGNQGIMQVIIEQLGFANPNAHILGASWWNVAKEELLKITETGPGGTGHACEFETSLMKVIAPHLVQESLIKQGANVSAFSSVEGDLLSGPKISFYRTMKELTPNGVYGNPTKASAEKGIRIGECVTSALKQLVMDVYKLKERKYLKS
ncbi:MAG: creatininase family protein [Daejeonella sp.]|uniref:creatininase family protein n=1 Tax=Daejeonella sp. TaxID=2805397 RepID=UPI00273671CC|nr:creatininase family protein [Daejeonella sp.]MDP3469034.1 creatininase family protein [Daejeonella sp.]